jgi:hypothetical protein
MKAVIDGRRGPRAKWKHEGPLKKCWFRFSATKVSLKS